MLACVETTDWAQVVKGAGSLEILARRHGLGEEIENHAFSIKTEAERGVGLAMAASEKATGTKGQLSGRDSSGAIKRSRQKKKAPSYAEQGVNTRLANKARQLAELTPTEVNAVVARDTTLAGRSRRALARLPDARRPWTSADGSLFYVE